MTVSVKSLQKQLIAAVAMVLVAMIALGSSTYAWFAANDNVRAEGMSVTAKSDVTYLMIKQGTATIEEIRTGKKTFDSALNTTAQLLPTAHEAITNKETADAVTSGNLTNWYYEYGTNPAESAGDGTKRTIASADKGKYILVNEFTLGLAAGSNGINNIKVGTTTLTTDGDSAVKVLVVSSTGAEEFSATGAGSATLQTSLSGDEVMSVWVYIYWDGADTDVFTNGIADLKSTAVTVTFTGTPVTT